MTSIAIVAPALLVLTASACFGLSIDSAPAIAAVNQPPQARNDLRDLHVGMAVADLPSQGYAELDCANNPDQKLAGWAEYARCRADDQGRYGINFKFDENTNVLGPLDDKYKGTRVGGHPVLLTLMIGEHARVVGLDIKTDPKARLSLRKRAFLLAMQAMNFYGPDGWKCERHEPGENEAPIGSVFIKERCEKALPQKKIIVERQLFRPISADIRDLVSTAEITVLNVH